MVRVKLYGKACTLAGTAEVEVAFGPGMDVQEVLRQVASNTGRTASGLVSAILVNGRNCAFREGLETALADGDTVELLPLITGG
jgi:molybdopterin converting factor small subunit